jgi:hypothetical protein
MLASLKFVNSSSRNSGTPQTYKFWPFRFAKNLYENFLMPFNRKFQTVTLLSHPAIYSQDPFKRNNLTIIKSKIRPCVDREH